jgi:gliding motility-associated-like protein
VFTPNGDAKNDHFKITGVGVKSFSCSIYNRWGLKLYEWNDINGDWNGTTNTGVKATSGSYFYIVNYTNVKDEAKTEKGFISLFSND